MFKIWYRQKLLINTKVISLPLPPAKLKSKVWLVELVNYLYCQNDPMKKYILLFAAIVLGGSAIGQVQLSAHIGLSKNYDRVVSDSRDIVASTDALPRTIVGLTLGYAVTDRLTLELDYSAFEIATGFSINTVLVGGNRFGFGGSSVTGGFRRLGMQAKYNVLRANSSLRLAPILGVAMVLSDLDEGVFSLGKGNSSNGENRFTNIEETAYTGSTALQLALGAEFAVGLHRYVELYVNVMYSFGTSDVLVTDLYYDINNPALANVTTDQLDKSMLTEKAVLANNMTMFHNSFGVRFKFGRVGSKVSEGQ